MEQKKVPPERSASPRDHSRGFQLTSNTNGWRFKAIFSLYREYSMDGDGRRIRVGITEGGAAQLGGNIL